jgi:hypothetical protein
MQESRVLNRRDLFTTGLALLPLATAHAQAPAQTPAVDTAAGTMAAIATANNTADALAVMRAMVAPAVGNSCAWWYFGTLSVHVDGLREFPIALVESVRLYRNDSLNDDELVLSWVEIGCLRDLASGAVASHWFNPYTDRSLPLPPSLIQGPGRYRIARTGAAVAVSLDESKATVNKLNLGAQLGKGRTVLTLSETKIRSFPTLTGAQLPPDVTLMDVTQDRTVSSYIGAADAATRTAGAMAATGYYSTVYDDLPSWLGFGERLGGAFVKGVMHRAKPAERVNTATWKALQRLHPGYFARGQLQFSR